MTTSVGPEIITVSDEAAQLDLVQKSADSSDAASFRASGDERFSSAQAANGTADLGPTGSRTLFDLSVNDGLVVQLPNGGFLFIYVRPANGRGPVLGQMFNADGTPSGGAFDIYNPDNLVNFSASNLQAVLLNDGRVAVAWTDNNGLHVALVNSAARTASAPIRITAEPNTAHVLTADNDSQGFSVVYKNVAEGRYYYKDYHYNNETNSYIETIKAGEVGVKDADRAYIGGTNASGINFDFRMSAALRDINFNGQFFGSEIRIEAERGGNIPLEHTFTIATRTTEVELVQYHLSDNSGHGALVAWIDVNGAMWVQRFTVGKPPASSIDVILSTGAAVKLGDGARGSLTMTELGDGSTLVFWTTAAGTLQGLILNNVNNSISAREQFSINDFLVAPSVTVLKDGRFLIEWADLNGITKGQIFDYRAKAINVEGSAVQENWLFGTGFQDTIKGANLNDTLVGGGDADELTGRGGHDSLSGGSGADRIFGEDGNDTIDGGTGGDYLHGGSNFDIVTYADSSEPIVASLLNEGNSGGATGDTFVSVEGLIGSKIGDTLRGDSFGNSLDGGEGDDNLSGNSGWDTLFGGGGNDNLGGDNGEDKLYGGTGNDIIYGGLDNDTLDGGANDDTFYGGWGEDSIVGGDGKDFVSFEGAEAATANLLTGRGTRAQSADDWYVGIEGLIGSNDTIDGDHLTGDNNSNWLEGRDGNDTLIGNGGVDELKGENGDDQLQGGAGGDILDGGSGIDLADYSNSETAIQTGLAGWVERLGQDAIGDGYTSIEGFIGSRFADRLFGGFGSQTLKGGAGNDRLVGLEDGDFLDGGDDIDLADYAVSTGNLTISLLDSNQNTGDAAGDRYANIEGIFGGQGNDKISGDHNANTLVGFLGNDTIEGYKGADLIDGAEGIDYASYEHADSDIIASLNGGLTQTGHATGDTYNNIEGLIGGAFNDRLIGNGSANTLQGGNGNDSLDGGAGVDSLDGGSGNDYADYRSRTGSGVNANLGTGANSDGDQYTSIEGLIGSDFNDTLTGSSISNTLIGGAGNDILDGKAGGDSLRGGAGDDTYILDTNDGDVIDESSTSGGAGNDTVKVKFSYSITTNSNVENIDASGADTQTAIRLQGNSADNHLKGHDGQDTLEGGAGRDTLEGGAGDDTYYATDDDRIIEIDGTDTRIVSAGKSILTQAGIEVMQAEEGALNVYLVAHATAGTKLIGNSGDNTLQGGGGVDALEGGLGNDIYLNVGVGDTITDNGGTTDTVVITTAGSSASLDWGSIEILRAGKDANGVDIEGIWLKGRSAALPGGIGGILEGNDTANTLEGGAGQDTLIGGKGNDTISSTMPTILFRSLLRLRVVMTPSSYLTIIRFRAEPASKP